MEINIISVKLLIYSTIIAVVIILFYTLIQLPKNSLMVTICNEQDTLDIYLRFRNNDFIINPTSIKNVTYCLSKSMPFYDRTIEYMINPSSRFKNEISKRYTIVNTLNEDKIKIAQFIIELSSKKVIISNNNNKVFIYKRPVLSLLDLYSNRPSEVLSVIRPASSESSERVLSKFSLDQQRVSNGEFIVNKY